jgi:hypothetical protein
MRVHPEPRGGVHLDDRAARLPDRLRDVGGEEVDPRDVEPHDARGLLGDLDVLLVGLPRPVDRDPTGRHVPRGDELDELTLGRNIVHREALLLHERNRGLVDLDLREDLLVADPTTRILVRDRGELGDGVPAVADHVRGHALGHGDHLPADDQHPIVVARHEALDHDAPAARLLQRALEPLPHVAVVPQLQSDAPSVVAVERLGDDRETEALGGVHRLVIAPNDLPARNRESRRGEETPSHVLVAGDVDRER